MLVRVASSTFNGLLPQLKRLCFRPVPFYFFFVYFQGYGGEKKPTGWLKNCKRLGKGPMMTQFQSKSLVGTGSLVPSRGREINFSWSEYDTNHLVTFEEHRQELWPGYPETATGSFCMDVNDGGRRVDFATTAVLLELDEVSSLKDQRTRLKVFPYSWLPLATD